MMTNVAKIYQFEFWPEIAPSSGKSHGTSHRRCSVKNMFLEIPQNSQENTCARVSFLIKLQALGWKKESLAHVLSCEFYEISINIFFTEHLLTTPSIDSKKCKNNEEE